MLRLPLFMSTRYTRLDSQIATFTAMRKLQHLENSSSNSKLESSNSCPKDLENSRSCGKIWKVQILAGKIWKIQDLATHTS